MTKDMDLDAREEFRVSLLEDVLVASERLLAGELLIPVIDCLCTLQDAVDAYEAEFGKKCD